MRYWMVKWNQKRDEKKFNVKLFTHAMSSHGLDGCLNSYRYMELKYNSVFKIFLYLSFRKSCGLLNFRSISMFYIVQHVILIKVW